MKFKNVKFILFFAALFVATGLMAQTPGNIELIGGDKEAQTERTSSNDRAYSKKRSGEKRVANRTRSTSRTRSQATPRRDQETRPSNPCARPNNNTARANSRWTPRRRALPAAKARSAKFEAVRKSRSANLKQYKAKLRSRFGTR